MFVRVKMPDGIVRRYEEEKVPECGIVLNAPKPADPEPEAKAAEPENKAVTEPANKAAKTKKKGGSKK